MGAPWRQHNYLGEFTTDALATTDVSSRGWGTPGVGMWYFNTTTNQEKYWNGTVWAFKTATEQKVVYVGKHGLDTNNGKSMANAFLTFGAAFAYIATQSPSVSNQWTIVCDDFGPYAENLIGQAWVNIHAPNAEIQGAHTIVDNMVWTIGTLRTTTGNCITKTVGTNIAWVHVDRMILTGTANGVTVNVGALCLCVTYLEVGNGIGLLGLTTSDIGVSFGQINITGTGIAFIGATATAVHICALGECIKGAMGTAVITVNGMNVELTCNLIQTAVCVNVGAGSTVNLRCLVRSGTETNAGTYNKIIAGGDISFGGNIQQTAASRWYQPSKMTTAEETAMIAGWGATQVGRMWYNTTLNQMTYWNGAALVRWL